jgi:NAD(P)H-nitrite reductase large subunit/rubredoxin
MTEQSWLCSVCGYVHIGAVPPECCPVCGADKSVFELKNNATPETSDRAPSAWRCLVCFYMHQGDSPPDNCPVCGACADQFEGIELKEAAVETQSNQDMIIIIGAGISGISAAEAARKTAPNARILVISREKELPYYRLNLTRFLAGELAAEQLCIHPAAWYEEQRIELLLDQEVEAIEVTKKTLQIKDGEALDFDSLILSLGAHSFIPPIEGADKKHVLGLRTRQDAIAISHQACRGKRCVVIGGGVLGLEAAAALAQRGADITIIEGFDWLLPRQLNRAAGEQLAEHVRKLGIRLVLGGGVQKLTGDEQVAGVALETGEVLPADLVVFAAGVRCNSALARQAKLEVNNGILVDNSMRTSHSDIFAVGDVAEHQGVIYGTWLPAQAQGAIAGLNAAGGAGRFMGVPRSNNLKVLDVDLFSIGRIVPEDGSDSLYEVQAEKGYFLFVFRSGQLVGAILLGDTSMAPKLKKLIEQQRSCSELLAGALDGNDLRLRLMEGF